MFKHIVLALILFCFSTVTAEADNSFTNRPDVQAFINQMVQKYHFDKKYLLHVFSFVKMRPEVMHQVRVPLEQKPWYLYQTLFVTEWRIKHGVEFWNKYHDVLEKAEKTYNVPASIIVATVGVETKYGSTTGEYPVIDSLSNIAFSQSPRANYFKSELKEFLLLTREHHLNPLKVMGSYAGAIGQPQFMPSSYRTYAVDFSGDGNIDLENNVPDIIGSIANYYHKHGWRFAQPVAEPSTFNRYLLLDKNKKIITLQGRYRNEYWITFPNFNVIKRYNPSDLYAMAVYQLACYIKELREKYHEA